MVKIWSADQVLLHVINEREETFLTFVLPLFIRVHLNGLAAGTVDEVLHVPVDLRPHLLLVNLAVQSLFLHVPLLFLLHFLEFGLLYIKLRICFNIR